MKLVITVVILGYSSLVFGITLPDEIDLSFRRSGHRIPNREELYGEQQPFLDYIAKNWRQITENIECLPPLDGEEDEIGVKFNCSVVRLGYACGHLAPAEYLDFFEQIVTLYEQKRISYSAFHSVYYGSDEKFSFWSVNWEHPRVQKIFDRIRKFDPPPDKDFLSMIEDQASGKLADNYMVNSSDDGPLPQTLPGIKLQRPFASVIRKYEAMTGKRVPADPDFPDHHNTRPSKKSLREADGGDYANSNTSMHSSGLLYWISILLLTLLGLFVWLKKKAKGERMRG